MKAMKRNKMNPRRTKRVGEGETLVGYDSAAERLNISVRTLQKLVKSGECPHVRIGRKVFFTEGILVEFIESCIRGEE